MQATTIAKTADKKAGAGIEGQSTPQTPGLTDVPGAGAGLPLFLQRSALTVSAPDDPYEREANQVADKLQRQPSTSSGADRSKPQSPPPTLPLFQRATQMRVPDAGEPLSPTVRKPFEQAVGVDLGGVRVHSSPQAQQTAQKLHAKAFTHQNHIWLGANQSPNDSRLLNHELTHVLQQSAGTTDDLQRAPADYQHPEDGGAVLRRMQQRIDEATDDDARTSANQTPQERAEQRAEARRKLHSVDRAEVNQERGTLQPEARPDVDRPAAEQPKVEQSAQETEAQANTPGEPLVEGEKKEEKGKEKKAATPVSEAEAAAGLADQAFSTAESFVPPTPDAPVMPPPPVAPIDAAGLPLPDNPEADMQASGLAEQAQMMREQGFNLRARANVERQNAEILRGNLGLVRSNLLQAEEGVSKSTQHLTFRRDLVGQAGQALTLSQQKTQMVAEQAPEYAGKADEGKEESGPMASESRDLAAENAANTPDDEEAAARAQEQGGKMNQAGSDIATTDDAISQTKSRAGSLGEEAARASEINTQTEGKLTSMSATLDQTNEKLGQMQQQNSTARGEMAALSSQPNQLRSQADLLDQQGISLIQASFEIEQNVQQTQNDYDSGMQSVPAPAEPEAEAVAEDATASAAAAQEPTTPEPPLNNEGEEALVQRQPSDSEAVATPALPQPANDAAAPDNAETTPAAENPPPVPADGLTSEPATAPEGSVANGGAVPPTTGYEGRTNLNLSGKVSGALPSWLTGVPSPNEEQREAARLAEEERRRTRLTQIQARADEVGGFANLSAYDKAALALSMTRDNLFGSVSKIKWPGWGHLAAGLIDPRGPLMGVVSGLSMTLSGAANLFSLQQWKQDPLGNLLKSAADIATGLTIILGSITALAGVIIAIMTAITILSFGFAAPVTGPVIAFCTTVLTTVGGWTLAVGKVALILQALVFIKNLIDAACAKNAQDLLTQSDQMTEDVSNAGNVVLQMGMAKLAQVGGRAAASEIQAAGGGVRFAAQLGARAGVGARALPGRIAAGVRGLPGRAVAGARALPGRVAGGLRAAGSAARGTGSRLLTGARALPGRALAGARALPGRALAGARALPGRIASGVRGLPGALRNAPGRVRQYLGERFNRNFIVGEGIPQGSGLRGAQAAATEARMNVFIDDILTRGGAIRPPSASSVARAQAALEAGAATPADIRVLVQKAVADARSFIRASRDAPLTWDVMRGACGPGRDVSASSFGALAAESRNPILLQRFQAQEVFGINKHGFSVVTFPGEPPTRYLVDPTFGQFLRPGRATPTLTGATAEVLRGDAAGSTFARNLARDGFVPLSEQNAALYARALGVPEAEAATIGSRLSSGEGALTREVIGGGGPLPAGSQRGPIGRLGAEGPDILDVAESLQFTREHIAKLQAQGDPGGVLPSLRELERRLEDSLQRAESGRP